MAKTVIIGCGNPVRGDDGAGPRLIRNLWERGLPPGIDLVDGGTSGIDVIFHMKEADRVVIVDACLTGERPGTIFRVPPEEVESLPAPEEAHLHSIRWFHAISIGRYLLNGEFPGEIHIFLIEGKSFSIGEGLSDEVKVAVSKLEEIIMEEFVEKTAGSYRVELDGNGYLKIPAELANDRFKNAMSVAVVPKGMELYIFPLPNSRQGGLLLKRLNKEGDRAVLIWEMIPTGIKPGEKKAVWDEESKALIVSLI